MIDKKRLVFVLVTAIPISLIVNYILCGFNLYSEFVFAFLIAWVMGDIYEKTWSVVR